MINLGGGEISQKVYQNVLKISIAPYLTVLCELYALSGGCTCKYLDCDALYEHFTILRFCYTYGVTLLNILLS